MPDIVLATLNAKYVHASFGLRYLLANLGPLQSRACLAEFDLQQRPIDIAESLLARQPRIIGLGVYIWNVAPTTELVAILKRLRPELVIVLGGPEVSFELDQQPVTGRADYVVTGEADLKFAELCRVLLEPGAKTSPPMPKVLSAEPPEFKDLALPYDFYTHEDVTHRILYVEASRGCPFHCEFCLSSLEVPVRQAPLPAFLHHLERLLDRGARHLKFVDRTFNLNIESSRRILEFLLERHRPGDLFHFEMIPDRLPVALREVIARFPPGSLQFEIGIQTFNESVSQLIHRRQDYARLEENFHFLRHETGVHLHADLIAGLPGETVESFAAGFDRLVALGPHEIQVGILKRLRGTPIVRHDAEWGMVYSPEPPYEVLQTRLIDFESMQRLRRFARYWDLVGNSGNFVETAPLLWSSRGTGSGATREAGSPFHGFSRWSEWLFARVGRTDRIALIRLMELLYEYLVSERGADSKLVAQALWGDYRRGGRFDKPSFLREHLAAGASNRGDRPAKPLRPKRQARHWA